MKGFSKPSKDVQKCDFLFASKDKKSLANKSIGYASGSSNKMLVTISDMKNFVRNSGGLVEIFEDKGRIKFALNLKKAKASKIKINSKLIETASKIY